jgi:hypothetical protein
LAHFKNRQTPVEDQIGHEHSLVKKHDHGQKHGAQGENFKSFRENIAVDDFHEYW